MLPERLCVAVGEGLRAPQAVMARGCAVDTSTIVDVVVRGLSGNVPLDVPAKNVDTDIYLGAFSSTPFDERRVVTHRKAAPLFAR